MVVSKVSTWKAPKPQYNSYQAAPKVFGKGPQDTSPNNDTAEVDEERVKQVQHVIGGVLYYARAVDLTTLPGLSSIASEQTKATEHTELKVR